LFVNYFVVAARFGLALMTCLLKSHSWQNPLFREKPCKPQRCGYWLNLLRSGAELLPDALVAIGVRHLPAKIRNHIGRNGHRRSLASDRI
jgi:hypothetical protein